MICLHAFRMPAREGRRHSSPIPGTSGSAIPPKSPVSHSLLPSAAAPPPHSPKGPDHHQRRCLRPPAGHQPSTAASTPPGPRLWWRWTMCGSAGVLSEAGEGGFRSTQNAPQPGRKVLGLPDKEISSGAVVMRWPAIYNKGSKIREEAHPVAKHLDKFAALPGQPHPPFALAEILTNGSGRWWIWCAAF